MTKIDIDVEDYIELLNERRAFVKEHYNWTIPDCLWDYFCDLVRECGLSGNTDPSFIVDNIAVNGDWGDFDNYKTHNETDEEFMQRVKDKVLYFNKAERIVCYSL